MNLPSRQKAGRSDNDFMVRLVGLNKTYDGRSKVVRDLDLDVASGEFLILLGPSGSGKTTTLMMLAGFETPTSGEIILDGQELTHLPPYKRDIGVVFQNYALFPNMNVAGNVAFPLEVRGVPKSIRDERVASALEMVRLPNLSARMPSELSGGQQQRVALARALVFEPKLVLMDEPLGALDRQLREALQLEIRSLHEKLGITIVYVTHDQGEALAMADRVAVFNNGGINQIGSAEDLYERPASAFVARFIGENNTIAGKLLSRSGTHCEVEVPGVGRIVASNGDIQEGDTDVLVTVRPECLTLRRKAASDSGYNTFQVRPEETIYAGDHRRMMLRLPDGQILSAKVASVGRSAPALDGHMEVQWEKDHCIAFRASDPA